MSDSPFRYEIYRGLAGGAPLVQLHGSSQDDRALFGFAATVGPDLAARAREPCSFIAEAIGRCRAP